LHRKAAKIENKAAIGGIRAVGRRIAMALVSGPRMGAVAHEAV
jgi:hypothetical protein